MPQVLWLPAHPSAGADSMDRYWREIERQSLLAPATGAQGDARGDALPEIACPLGSAPANTHLGSRLERGWQKYFAYPRLARRSLRGPGVKTAHILDHSFAHLFANAPRDVFKVVTMHDLAPLREPGDLNDGQIRRFRKIVNYLHEADLVIADSRHSAAEATELLGCDPAKVRVLPLGVNCQAFASRTAGRAPAWKEQLAGRKVVLSVGHAIARKNLRILPAIFAELRRKSPGMKLTLLRVGAMLPAELREELSKVLGPGGLIELGRVPEAGLVLAYQSGDALVFPSRQEGFGFPILEAMAAGCPVVCTNVSSLPEVGGEAALYFSPDDPAGAAVHLDAALNDDSVRAAVISAGLRQAAALSWEQHFAGLLEIYRGGAAGVRTAA